MIIIFYIINANNICVCVVKEGFIDKMKRYEIRCKNCGKKLLTYSKGCSVQYKSPVKICRKCGTMYADPRCHEIALDGIPPDTFSVRSNAVFAIIGALILYRGIYLFGKYQLGVPNKMQWMLPSVFVIWGAATAVWGIAEIILIVSGMKKRKFDALKRESEERLNDKNYAAVLRNLGYEIPEKYL